jgi:RNA polymerase sigma-70 factor (ECF subfamily)
MVRKAEPLDKVPHPEDTHTESRTDIKDALRYLLQEMEKLPDKQRMVIRMRAVDGLEYEDIARRTGLSEVYIRVLVTMARKTLKTRIRL